MQDLHVVLKSCLLSSVTNIKTISATQPNATPHLGIFHKHVQFNKSFCMLAVELRENNLDRFVQSQWRGMVMEPDKVFCHKFFVCFFSLNCAHHKVSSSD